MTQEESNKLFNKYFRSEKDESITFLGSKLIIMIPEHFIKDKITNVSNNIVETIGIFEGYIFDDDEEEDLNKANHKYTFKAPDMLFFTPSHIEKVAENVENETEGTLERIAYLKLIFLQGDTYISNVNSIESLDTSNAMLAMLLGANMPSTLNYEDYLLIWDKCNRRNKSKDLNANISVLALIVSNIVRCPDDLMIPFRFKSDKYYAKGINNGKSIRVYDIPKYTSNYASFTSADVKRGLTVAMEQSRVEGKKDNLTPVEIAIS